MPAISSALAQIRGLYKLADQDSEVTDRFLYGLMKSAADVLMRRQDSSNKLMKFNGIFQPLEYVELIEVDAVSAGCLGAPSGCTFKRTRDRLPSLNQGYYGPLLRFVGSLDQSIKCEPIFAAVWKKQSTLSTARYNKTKYYWHSDGYLYFPNLLWDAVYIDGLFEFDVSHFNCNDKDDCLPRQQSPLSFPDFLFQEIKGQIRQDLGLTTQIPGDPGQDNKHPLN